MPISRRDFLNAAPLALAPAMWPLADAQAQQAATALPPSGSAGTPGVSPTFPSQAPELARDMVGASHANITRVKELLALSPNLARASWDWGFGDWEDALGAASHVGNREIAALLLANGARPTIFSAAMLGQLETVRGFIAASPGIEATLGPHSINLMRHAIAGGVGAQPVVEYLKTLPGADWRPENKPIAPEAMAGLAGEYLYGSGADERITVAVASTGLTFQRGARNVLRLTHAGDNAFFPPGAPAVRIRFRESSTGVTLMVHDPGLVLEVTRAR